MLKAWGINSEKTQKLRCENWNTRREKGENVRPISFLMSLNFVDQTSPK